MSRAVLHEIESSELRISPMVLLEMQFLREIGRVTPSPGEWLTILRRDFDVTVCALPFHTVLEASIDETWTRDPFDRIIVAQARTGGGNLLTKDRQIHKNFTGAVW